MAAEPERETFRVRLDFGDGDYANFDVVSLAVYVWNDGPLEITTEDGLVIRGRLAAPVVSQGETQ